jgi:iron(III) transport system ATP-binding protein
VNLLVRADGLPLRVRVETSDLSLDAVPKAGDELEFTVNPARAVVITREESQDDYLTVATNAIVSPR